MFSSRAEDGSMVWFGDPDCQAAHEAVLGWLRKICPQFLPLSQPLDNIRKGNIGESIAFFVGLSTFAGATPFAANALTPLASISRPDIDIVWLVFGTRPEQDRAVLQEVKTTSDPGLAVAEGLPADYDKLFGRRMSLTLHTRLQAIKNKLEYTLKKPELCPRVSALAGVSPKTSPKLELLPTLVYDRCLVPGSKLTSVRSTIVSRGWSAQQVTTWAVGLSELDERLQRLSGGRN